MLRPFSVPYCVLFFAAHGSSALWLIDIMVIFPVTMMRSETMEILLMMSDEYTHGLWLLADLRARFLPSAKTTKRFARVVLAVCSLSAVSGSSKCPPTLRGWASVLLFLLF